jgi:hypothetical protein
LHASSTPSAFNLNQDQILKKNKFRKPEERLPAQFDFINRDLRTLFFNRFISRTSFILSLAHCLSCTVKIIWSTLGDAVFSNSATHFCFACPALEYETIADSSQYAQHSFSIYFHLYANQPFAEHFPAFCALSPLPLESQFGYPAKEGYLNEKWRRGVPVTVNAMAGGLF